MLIQESIASHAGEGERLRGAHPASPLPSSCMLRGAEPFGFMFCF